MRTIYKDSVYWLLPVREGRSGRWEHGRLLRQSHEFGDTLHLQFGGDRSWFRSTVRIMDAEIGGDLLLSLPCTTWESTSSSLAVRASGRAQILAHCPLLTFARVAGQGAVYGLDQFFLRRPLFKKIYFATAHRA